MEWAALNKATRSIFWPTSSNGLAVSNSGPVIPDDPAVVDLVGKHLNLVLTEALEKVSFFLNNWEIRTDGSTQVLSRLHEFPAGLALDGTNKISGLLLEVAFPSTKAAPIAEHSSTIEARILGKISRICLVTECAGAASSGAGASC